MRPEDRDAAFLWDMLEAAQDIRDFIEGISADAFAADKKIRYAVERQHPVDSRPGMVITQ